LCNILDPEYSSCIIGDHCDPHSKSIGLTLDNILNREIKTNTTFNHQSFSIKISAALTIIMFIGGSLNSVLTFITFKAEDAQQVGCGMYLLVSAVTSFLTISMFVVKFWFVVLTQINISTSLSILRGGCVSIEPILKLCLYSDTWLNACVAVERAIHVLKGVQFDKKKSKRIARWIIIILPFCIMATLIHESIYRELFVYQPAINKTVDNETYVNRTDEGTTERYVTLDRTDGGTTVRYAPLNRTDEGTTDGYVPLNRADEGTTERYVSCVTPYSRSVQDYNTVILFFHLIAPFIANLFSALFIIFGAARQRSVVRTGRSFKQHVCEQFREHKQLIISPMVLFVLSVPRLITSALHGCLNTSGFLWLYLGAYFISFTPSMLIFMIFVFPSDLYMKIFKESFSIGRRGTRQ
jgi:hypothetical protein